MRAAGNGVLTAWQIQFQTYGPAAAIPYVYLLLNAITPRKQMGPEARQTTSRAVCTLATNKQSCRLCDEHHQEYSRGECAPIAAGAPRAAAVS